MKNSLHDAPGPARTPATQPPTVRDACAHGKGPAATARPGGGGSGFMYLFLSYHRNPQPTKQRSPRGEPASLPRGPGRPGQGSRRAHRSLTASTSRTLENRMCASDGCSSFFSRSFSMKWATSRLRLL